MKSGNKNQQEAEKRVKHDQLKKLKYMILRWYYVDKDNIYFVYKMIGFKLIKISTYKCFLIINSE